MSIVFDLVPNGKEGQLQAAEELERTLHKRVQLVFVLNAFQVFLSQLQLFLNFLLLSC